MKFYITGIRRGLGKYLHDRLNVVETLEECDIFINCKHDGFSQVDNLYEAIGLGKRVINLGSYASDWIYHPSKTDYVYAVEKKALRDANSQLFDNGYPTTCLNLGYFNSERSAHVTEYNKMSMKSVLDSIEFVLLHHHRVKEITITPTDDLQNEQLLKSEKILAYTDMYASQHKKINRKYNITKIKEEIKDLPPLKDNQVMLQSVDGKDFYTGVWQLDTIPEGMEEADFNKLNVPEDSEIARFIKTEGLTRARLLVLPEKSCYTFHYDPTPRIHLVVQTNEWSFMTDDRLKLFHVPANGYPYYFDTTKPHTALNSSWEDRIHIVGIAPLK